MDATTVMSTVERMRRMPKIHARARFSDLVNDAHWLKGEEQKLALDFNAHLATALRVAGVKIWESGN